MSHGSILSPLSQTLMQLFKGVIYQEQQAELWLQLLQLQHEVKAYVAQIGLTLYIDEAEGYALLKQIDFSEQEQELGMTIPKLLPKRPLSYPVSLLCVLLRKYLLEQDVTGGAMRPIISQDQIIEMMRVYLPEKHNEARIIEQIATAINKVIDLGFLRSLKQQDKNYEIQRIIKAFIDADWLTKLDEKLNEYQEHATTAI